MGDHVHLPSKKRGPFRAIRTQDELQDTGLLCTSADWGPWTCYHGIQPADSHLQQMDQMDHSARVRRHAKVHGPTRSSVHSTFKVASCCTEVQMCNVHPFSGRMQTGGI